MAYKASKIINKELQLINEKEKKKQLWENKEWWTIRSLLGNQWARWFILIGARERGKSYSVQEYALNQRIKKGVPFYWIRLNEESTRKMLQNNGAKMFEPLLVEKFKLNVKTKNNTVYNDKEKLCDVFALSTAHNYKGAALYDQKNFKGCNIIIDEFQLEKSQRKCFDIPYQLKLLIENICRSNYKNVRIFLIANNTEECSEILSENFSMIPLEWGIYKLKSRHCIIDYIPNNKAYEERRKEALVTELEKNSQTSNFTNKVLRDFALITKKRLHKPNVIIKFSKDCNDWFTVWDGNVICPYNKEKLKSIAMRRYIDDFYNADLFQSVIERNDGRAFLFKNLITQTRFYNYLKELKK